MVRPVRLAMVEMGGIWPRQTRPCPTSSLVRVLAIAAAASVRWCGLVAPTIGANTTGLAKRPDHRDRWAITSAPGDGATLRTN